MRLPFRSLATLLMAVGVATCSDGPTSPNGQAGGGSHGAQRMEQLAFTPVFSKTAQAAFAERDAFGLTFDSVRVIIRGYPDTTAIVKDTTVAFAPGSGDLTLNITVPVQTTDQAFGLGLAYQNNGQTVFSGSGVVHAHAADQTAPTEQITINYTGPGASVARIVISPRNATVSAGGAQTFTVQGFDANGTALSVVPVTWTTSDATIATITTDGVLQPVGSKRGTVTVTATTPNQISDQTTATITLPATSLVVVSGGDQTGPVGSTLPQPVVVQAQAADGAGVAGVTVNFAAPAGNSGGKVGTSSAVTDANGTASTTLTLGNVAGPQGFAATAGAFSVGINETATAASPTAIALVSGDQQSDTVHKTLMPLVVKVSDSFGNGVSGVTVNWARTSGSGSLSAPTSVTGADGTASVTYTLGTTTGAETVVASVTGISTSVTFTLHAVTATPAAIAIVSGNNQSGAAGSTLSAPLVVQVTDAAGKPAVSVPVSWSATNGTISAATTTDAQGQSSNTLTLGPAGGQSTVTASVNGGAAGSKIVTFTANVLSGAPAQLGFGVQPAVEQVDAPFTPAIQVQLRDASGTPTTGSNAVTIALGANPGETTLSGTLTKNAVNGVATFSDLSLNQLANGYTLVASAAGLGSVTSAPFNVVRAIPVKIQLVGGTSINYTAGTDVDLPYIRVTDVNGDGVGGVAVHLHVTQAPSNVVVGDSTFVTNEGGNISFADLGLLEHPTAGTFTVTATSGTLQGSPLTIPVVINPGTPEALVFLNDTLSTVRAGSVLPALRVAFEDGYGNIVTSQTGTITMSIGGRRSGATLGGTTTVNAVNGVATFSDLTINKAGTNYVLCANGGELSQASTQPFTVTAGPPATLAILTQPATEAVSGVPLSPQPVVQLQDGYGNATPSGSVQVTATVSLGGGVVSGGTVNADPTTGTATFTNLTLTFALPGGNVAFIFSAPGVTSVTSNAVALVASESHVVTWLGGTSTSWQDGRNWSSGSVPGATDSVSIGTASFQPQLTANTSVGGVRIASGGSLNLNGDTLNVSGNVDGGTGTGITNGVVNMISTASSTTLQGKLPAVIVGAGGTFCGGPFTAAGPTTTNSVMIKCLLQVNSALTVNGTLATSGAGGTLSMTSSSASVNVANAAFDGNEVNSSYQSYLSAGQLQIAGNLDVHSHSSNYAFYAGSAFRTVFTGTGRDSVSFDNESIVNFGSLQVSTPAPGATVLPEGMVISGDLIVDANAQLVTNAAGAGLVVQGNVSTGAGSRLDSFTALLFEGNSTFPSLGGTLPSNLEFEGTAPLTMTADASFPNATVSIQQPINVSTHTLTLGTALVEGNGQINMASGSNVVVDSLLTIFSATNGMSVTGGTLEIKGPVFAIEQGNAPSIAFGATVLFDGSGTQQFVTTNAANTFANVQVNDTLLTQGITVTNNLDVESGGVFHLQTPGSPSSALVTVNGILQLRTGSTFTLDGIFNIHSCDENISGVTINGANTDESTGVPALIQFCRPP